MIHKKRGRPNLKLVKSDKGTTELQYKKRFDVTTEKIDLIFKNNLISKSQHSAALHFRWLYILKFGMKNLTRNYSDDFGETYPDINSEWREAREFEYNSAIIELKKIGAEKIIMDVCIFNRASGFFSIPNKNIRLDKDFQKFTHGLQLFNKIWQNNFNPQKNSPSQRIILKKTLQKSLSN